MIELTYRPMKMEDADLRFKWLNDPGTNKHLGGRVRGGTDIAFHKQWMKDYLADESAEIFMALADGTPIGLVGLRDINKFDSNATLYIIIGEKEFRGQGLGKVMIKYILDYGFNTLDFHKITLDVHAENTAAIKCYTACGFREEGRYIDQVCYTDGSSKRYADEVRMMLINPNYNHNNKNSASNILLG